MDPRNYNYKDVSLIKRYFSAISCNHPQKVIRHVNNGAEDAQGNLLVYLTASTLSLDAKELFTTIIKYRDEVNNAQNLVS